MQCIHFRVPLGIVPFFLIGLYRRLAYTGWWYGNVVSNGTRMTFIHRAASHSTANTDVASDEDSNGENYIIYEHPGLASVREVMLMSQA